MLSPVRPSFDPPGWTHDEPPRAGDVIGQRCGASYIVTSLLGEGGMGQVYLATSELLAGKRAAVKVLQRELMRRPEGLARFRAEVYAAATIDDANIVHVFDAGELADGRLYMMMELCEGGSLAGLLEKRGALPFELIVTIVAQVASALAAAHAAKITHRDIKPANILLAQDKGGPLRARLADFGIAKLHDDQLSLAMATGTKKILGSPGYMAPEQCSGKGAAAVDYRADIYAFAACLYEMVTGQRPYPGNNFFDLINSVVRNAPFPRPSQLRPDLPPEWEPVILTGLAHKRDDRTLSLQEMVMRLARAIPNGEALVSYVAPRLIENKAAPTAATIADGIGPAVTQWAAAHSTTSARRTLVRVAQGLGMLAIGAAVGATAIVVAHRTHAAVPPMQATAIDAGIRADAPPILAVAPAPAPAPAIDAAIAPAPAPVPAPPDAAPISIVSNAPDKPSVVIAKPPHPSVSPPAVVERGTLRVDVDPWAEVSITGRRETFTTPVTTNLPAGHYRIVLSKGERKETVDVTIAPDQTTRVSRTW